MSELQERRCEFCGRLAGWECDECEDLICERHLHREWGDEDHCPDCALYRAKYDNGDGDVPEEFPDIVADIEAELADITWDDVPCLVAVVSHAEALR